MRFDTLPVQEADTLLGEAIEDFMLHQKACRNSATTQRHYRESLTRMKAWMELQDIRTVDSVTTTLIREWLVHLADSKTPRGTPLKSGTVWTAYKNARVFFNFLFEEDMIKSNPILRVKAPKLDQELLPAFTIDEIQRLQSATSGKDPTSFRNRAMVFFLLDSGCRLSEFANLRITDVNLETGIVKVVKGKGSKDRMTRIGSNALRALNKYLRVRRSIKSDLLWVGAYGALTAPGIRIILERLGKSCGVHCHAHKFRRTTALTMLRNGCDVFSIKSLLGHSDLQVLQRYLAQTEADISRAHELFSPLDQMSGLNSRSKG